MAIRAFRGAHQWLSNFHPAPVALDGEAYPTVEHAFQAAKSADPAYRASVRAAPSPARAKRLGRRADPDPGWEDRRIGVLRGLVRQKFADPALARLLLATGDEELVEGNWWHDNFWGECGCDRCDNAPLGPYRGQNWLGRVLMEERSALLAHAFAPAGG